MTTDTAVAQRGAHLPAQESSWARPDSMSAAMEFAGIMAKSDMVPSSHRGKPGNVLVCMQIAESHDVPLLTVLQNVAVINGKPTIWGNMALALVRRHPDCESVEEHYDDKSQTAVCKVRRRGQEPIVGTFSVEDADRANLWGKQGPWTQYPKRMLQMRARGFALRDAFPDALMGLITREEAQDYPQKPERRTAEVQRPSTAQDAIAKVSQKFAPKDDEVEVDPAADCRKAMIAEVREAFGDFASGRELIEETIGRWPDKESPPSFEECRKIRAAVAEHVKMTTGSDLPEGYDDLVGEVNS